MQGGVSRSPLFFAELGDAFMRTVCGTAQCKTQYTKSIQRCRMAIAQIELCLILSITKE